MRNFWRYLFTALLLAVVAMVLLPGAGAAQSPTPTVPTDDQVNAVAKTMYCPVCENIPLDVCPTQSCAEWRELIRSKLAEGKTTAEIRAEFAQLYGDRVLDVPPARGLNWLVYLVPPLVIVAGIAVLVLVLRNSRHKASPEENTPPAPPAQSDPYLARVEDELRRREKKS